MMMPVGFLRLRRAWRRAQVTHSREHELKMELTYSCDAVSHWAHGDIYDDIFDRDRRRKFLMEYRP